jgi:hypothetical protein
MTIPQIFPVFYSDRSVSSAPTVLPFLFIYSCLTPNPHCPQSLLIPPKLCPICVHISLIYQQNGCLVNICCITQTFYELI